MGNKKDRIYEPEISSFFILQTVYHAWVIIAFYQETEVFDKIQIL